MSRAVRIAPLLDWIPSVSPRFRRPLHLAPLTAVIERARTEPVMVVSSVPPRHGKSESLSHGIAWHLVQRPTMRIALVTYSQRFSEKWSRKTRELAQRVGVPLASDATARADWRTGVDDGGVWATSVNGPITGEGFDLIVIDDPVKDRAQAESALEREKIGEWFGDVLFSRLEPGGSVIVNGARWHVDDLEGRLIDQGWENVNIPAISAEGKALWPVRYPIDQLRRIEEQIGDYGFASLYQGQPRARGGAVFRDVYTYETLPEGMRIRIGVDFAYSKKTHADYSVAVVLGHVAGVSYVLDVVRLQVTAPEFLSTLTGVQDRHGGAPLVAYIGGTEKGVIDTFATMGVRIDARPATADKFTRAQPVAAAWNAGKVLLPKDTKAAPWVNDFVSEVCGFTGINDRHDDQVDAMAGAFSVATRKPRERVVPPPVGTRNFDTGEVSTMQDVAYENDRIESLKRALGL